MPAKYPERYTLAAHEHVPLAVVSTKIPSQLVEAKVREHCGVVFADYATAEKAADQINDAAAGDGVGVYADLTNAAHIAGFSKRLKVNDRPLYIPIKTPEGTI